MLYLTKSDLRFKIKNILKSLPTHYKNSQSNSITKKILQMPAFKYAQRINIYLNTDDEVNTIEILKVAFQQNKKIFIPLCHKHTMDMVRLYNFKDYENLPTTKWNIKEPKLNEQRENALDTGGFDLMLIPGMAFTINGGRCGHGRGYYDKFLSKYFQLYPEKLIKNNLDIKNIDEHFYKNKTLLIGLAFKEQIVADTDLPMEKTDIVIDLIVTSD